MPLAGCRRLYKCIGRRVVPVKDPQRGIPASRSAGFEAVTTFFERNPIQPVVSSKAMNIIIFVSHIYPNHSASRHGLPILATMTAYSTRRSTECQAR
jgi:hypothetical protein